MRLSSQNPRDMKALIQRQEEELIHLREEVEFLKEGKKLVIWKYREAAARIEKLEAALRFYAGWPQGSAGNIAPFLMDAGRIARAALAAPSGALEEEK